MKQALSFEYQRMATTAKAVDQACQNIQASGKTLPSLVLSSHVEAKLVAWALMLRDAGFRVCVCPSNQASAMPEELSRLVNQGIQVFQTNGEVSANRNLLADLCEFGPDLVFDDGALLIKAFTEPRAPILKGAVEFTTSGHNNLQEEDRQLNFPIYDMGLSYCKYELGNVYGTGVSALAAVASSVNVHLASRRVLVVGYGAVGRGVAKAASDLGAQVLVADNRVKNRVRAVLDGHQIGTLDTLVSQAELVITCSGSNAALTADLLCKLPDQAIVANVGCFASEIDVQGLRAHAEESLTRQRQIESFRLRNGKHIHLLANGELVNLAVGRGWPIELIDLCFALSTLCFVELWTANNPRGLQTVPERLEDMALELFLDSR